MSEKIQEALSKLDVNNDNHWTADGLPRLDTVKMFANDPSITRDALTAAFPGFTRATSTSAPAPVAAPVVAPPVVVTAPAAPQAAAPEVVPPVAPPVVAVTADAPLEKPEEAGIAVVSLEEELALERALLSELAVAKAQVEAQYNAQIKKVDALILAAEAQKKGDTNAQAIQEYLASERRKLQERAQRIQALKGVDLSAILPTKSPIDVAMARRNTRGGARPIRGV